MILKEAPCRMMVYILKLKEAFYTIMMHRKVHKCETACYLMEARGRPNHIKNRKK